MKQINVYFEDKEFEDLYRLKDKKSWHDFILQLVPKAEEGDKNDL